MQETQEASSEDTDHRCWKDNQFVSRVIEITNLTMTTLGGPPSSDLLYILGCCSFMLVLIGIVFTFFGDSVAGFFVMIPGVFLLLLSGMGTAARWIYKEKNFTRSQELVTRTESRRINEPQENRTTGTVNAGYTEDHPPRYSDIFNPSGRPPSYTNCVTSV